jgi:hypothetical protein
MSKAPEDYAALPFIGGNPEEEAPEFGKVTGKETMKLTLYVDNARRLQEATGLVPYTLSQAANVFGLIYRIASSGLELQENELCSLAELCQRGLDAVEAREGAAISNLNLILNCALAHHAKQEADQ